MHITAPFKNLEFSKTRLNYTINSLTYKGGNQVFLFLLGLPYMQMLGIPCALRIPRTFDGAARPPCLDAIVFSPPRRTCVADWAENGEVWVI